MGELHLDVLVTRLTKEMKIKARVGNPQVTYRESVTKETSGTEKFSKVIAGKENTAGVGITIRPLPSGSGNRYTCSAKVRGMDEQYYEAVKRGVTNAFKGGIQFGYETVDLEVEVTSITYNELTATPFAFEACAAMCFDKVAQSAAPILMEPVMKVTVIVPNQYVGEAISSITSRVDWLTASRAGRQVNISMHRHHCLSCLVIPLHYALQLKAGEPFRWSSTTTRKKNPLMVWKNVETAWFQSCGIMTIMPRMY